MLAQVSSLNCLSGMFLTCLCKAKYDCMNQGLSVGWSDIYRRSFDCQWIDITGIANGTYLLQIEVNANHAILESNYDNNSIWYWVTIPA